MIEELRYPDITSHHLVASTAIEMAETIYEELCLSSNALYKGLYNRKDFIQICAPTLRQAARIVLAKLLNDPNTSTMQKDIIYDALCMDASLPKTGTSIIHKDHH